MKTMLSGVKPSGQLHLGNYIGALRNFVAYQDDYQMIVFIANLHCITVPQDPIELHTNLRDCIALYLACGLDPKKSIIFLQSDVMAHAQLGFIIGCHTYLGELNRMTQFKDKSSKGEQNLSSGFYTYPTLMASDILIYDADFVPVGEDQKQHVELARDVAIRMNNRYGPLFKVPECLTAKVGARIMSLSDPLKKMSKSDRDGDKGCIYLLDPLDKARKKIMSAVTDSLASVRFDKENQPGVSNLLQILSALTSEPIDSITNRYQSLGYGSLKKEVADAVCATLEKIQSRYKEILASGLIESSMSDGAYRAKILANAKLKLVQEKIGLEIETQ